MQGNVRIEDHVLWFKQVLSRDLRERLAKLATDEEIALAAEGVVGKWKRMRPYPDGTATEGIKPVGGMKRIWNGWYAERKGSLLQVSEVTLADDYLSAGSALFSEWLSPEDEEAFRDL